MARQVASSVENNFVNGLISQATGLNFPEKACVDTDNCIFWEWGAVTRRLGIDFEGQNVPMTVTRTDKAFSTFVWKNVANQANTTLLVQQVGSTLYFWDTISYVNISLGLIPSTIDLTTHEASGSGDPGDKECQFANGHGVLFVYHPTLEPFYVSYDSGTRTVSATTITIQIRDFAGEDDGLGTADRPNTNMAGISAKHHYNLLNQGWTEAILATWDTARSDLPSNADIMSLFKNASEVFDTTTIDNFTIFQGNTPAPRGHYVLNVFNQDRITASSVAGLTTPSTGTARVSTGAFYAGRVWYSGIDAQGFKGYVLFSQIIDSSTKYGYCYQKNDPTSDNFFDLLADDGGVINIAEAGTIYKLIPVQNALLVFASNGVWAITGSTGLGFTALDYSVNKVGEIPSISGSSFVNVAGFPMWWNYDGIYSITAQGGGAFGVQSLTEKTIKSFYQSIPDDTKLKARGCYNNILKTVQWAYRDLASTSITDRYNFNRLLTFNLNTGAFYPWSISNADPRLNGLFFVESVAETIAVNNVVDGSGNQVVDGSGNNVVVYTESGLIEARNVYITNASFSGTNKLTFALQTDTDYLDFTSYDNIGTNYTSYLVSGYKLHGNALTKFQPTYLNIFSHTEDEEIEFYFRAIWDYALSSGTNRWSTQQLVSHNDTDYSYAHKRLKVRGMGHTLQFRIDSVTGKAFDVAGWAAQEGINRAP